MVYLGNYYYQKFIIFGRARGRGGRGGHHLESFHIAQMGLTTILQVFFLSGKCFITSSSQKKKLSCAVA